MRPTYRQVPGRQLRVEVSTLPCQRYPVRGQTRPRARRVAHPLRRYGPTSISSRLCPSSITRTGECYLRLLTGLPPRAGRVAHRDAATAGSRPPRDDGPRCQDAHVTQRVGSVAEPPRTVGAGLSLARAKHRPYALTTVAHLPVPARGLGRLLRRFGTDLARSGPCGRPGRAAVPRRTRWQTCAVVWFKPAPLGGGRRCRRRRGDVDVVSRPEMSRCPRSVDADRPSRPHRRGGNPLSRRRVLIVPPASVFAARRHPNVVVAGERMASSAPRLHRGERSLIMSASFWTASRCRRAALRCRLPHRVLRRTPDGQDSRRAPGRERRIRFGCHARR